MRFIRAFKTVLLGLFYIVDIWNVSTGLYVYIITGLQMFGELSCHLVSLFLMETTNHLLIIDKILHFFGNGLIKQIVRLPALIVEPVDEKRQSTISAIFLIKSINSYVRLMVCKNTINCCR